MDLTIGGKVGKYMISDICFETYPCQHYVTNINTGESSRISGATIFCMLRDDKLSHPHFDKYREYIRKRENLIHENLAEKNT